MFYYKKRGLKMKLPVITKSGTTMMKGEMNGEMEQVDTKGWNFSAMPDMDDQFQKSCKNCHAFEYIN